MEDRYITCSSIGNYGHAISKGKTYKIINEDEEKYRVKGNHGRAVWISKYYFIEGIVSIPLLESWKFDDDINDFDLVEVTLTFTDGCKRWCLVTTPQKLVKHFSSDNLDPPGFNIQHLIVNKTLDISDVDKILKHLDEQDELINASKPLFES